MIQSGPREPLIRTLDPSIPRVARNRIKPGRLRSSDSAHGCNRYGQSYPIIASVIASIPRGQSVAQDLQSQNRNLMATFPCTFCGGRPFEHTEGGCTCRNGKCQCRATDHRSWIPRPTRVPKAKFAEALRLKPSKGVNRERTWVRDRSMTIDPPEPTRPIQDSPIPTESPQPEPTDVPPQPKG